ncbi:MAG TPA: AAA family ATPase [Candidatus Dormibacteraeota bacterium]|nr:AAA family ATPase [Candidatus Dormibacteraeota bacterium]
MYKTFFGLRESPFNVNPDPRFLYLTPQTQAAMDELTYGIQNRKGFILLTGEVGTGKTTLINYLLNWLKARKTPTAFIFNSHLSANHLFDFILTDFGIPSDYRFNNNMLMRLNTWLIERFRAGERPVLIIDEAQGLSSELLEEIRLLLNLETASEKLLQIVLAGQPELEQKLKRPELRQLQQRITLRCNTGVLSLAECHGYIVERLRIAGATRDIFAGDAMDAVYFYSQGIPRVVNLLCEHALINAYVEHSEHVRARMVEDAAHEFLLDERRPVAMRRNVQEMSNDHLAVIHTIFSNGLGSQLAGEEQKAPAPVLQATKAETVMAMEAPALRKKAEPVILLEVANKSSKENEFAEMLPLLAASAKKKTQGTTSISSASAAQVSADTREVIAAPMSSKMAGIEDVRPEALQTIPVARAERPIPIAKTEQPRTPERVSAAAAQSAHPTGVRVRVAGRANEQSRSARWLRSPMAANLPAIAHPTLFRIISTMLLLQSVLRSWSGEFRSDWQAMIRTTPWPRMKKVFVQWLRQPIRSEVWGPTKGAPMRPHRNAVPQKT